MPDYINEVVDITMILGECRGNIKIIVPQHDCIVCVFLTNVSITL